MRKTAPSVIWLENVDTESPEIGGRSRLLAQLIQANFPLPAGFLITDHAYFTFLKENKLDHKVAQILSTIAVDRPDSLMQGERHITKLFEEAKLSDAFQDELLAYYDELDSDLTIELHATGKHQVKHSKSHAYTDEEFIQQIKDAWATMFTASALWHRHHQEINHMTTGAVLLVTQKLPSKKTGKVTTIGHKTHDKDKITIITDEQDHYTLSKKNLTILDRNLKHNSNNRKLTHDELLEIATLAKALEKHLYFPQEISWAYEDDDLYIVDFKPISTLAEQPTKKPIKVPTARGKGITKTIGTGMIKIIKTNADLGAISGQHIVIIKEVLPHHFEKLKKAKGVISESGHPHTEIALLLRQHGIPTIFNVKDATKTFKNGQLLTIHGDKGELYLGGF